MLFTLQLQLRIIFCTKNQPDAMAASNSSASFLLRCHKMTLSMPNLGSSIPAC